MLCQGLIRRVGDGKNTNIWSDNWLSRENLKRPITHLKANPPIFVSELLDRNTTSWKEELIREVFIPVDCAAILKIPICTNQQEDFWAWEGERDGNLSVRFAYRMFMHTKRSREAMLE